MGMGDICYYSPQLPFRGGHTFFPEPQYTIAQRGKDGAQRNGRPNYYNILLIAVRTGNTKLEAMVHIRHPQFENERTPGRDATLVRRRVRHECSDRRRRSS